MIRLIVFLLFCSQAAFAQQPAKEIVGTWEGVDGNDTLTFVFETEGYFTMMKSKQSFGGRSMNVKGKNMSLTYALDETQSPMHLDLILTDLETGVQNPDRMLALVSFIDDNSLKMIIGRTRPDDIDKGFIIHRKK